jgi:hypothetical protein
MGSAVLDWADDALERLEIGSHDCAAGHSDGVAAQALQTILVDVVSAKRARTTVREFGDSETSPNHGCSQRVLGRTADTRRTPETRIRNFGANGFAIDAEEGQEALAYVENVSARANSSPWISSQWRRFNYASCTFLSCWPTIAVASCISMSPNIRLRSGLHSKSLKLFPRTARRDIWFGIEMASMVITSRPELKEWAWSRFGLRRGVLGKTVTWNA